VLVEIVVVEAKVSLVVVEVVVYVKVEVESAMLVVVETVELRLEQSFACHAQLPKGHISGGIGPALVP